VHGDLLTAILWSVIPAILLFAGIYYLDRFEKEPGRLILIALGAGAIVAPVAVAWIEKAFDVPNSVATSQAVIVPAFVNANQAIIVTIVLGLVMLGVFFLVRHEIDDLLDGLVYGAVVGIGFGLASNFWVIWTTPDILGGPSTHTLASTVLSSLNWVFYAGVIGLFLGFARRGSLGRVLAMLVAGVAVAMAFALFHDYLPGWVATDSNDVATSGLASFLTDLPNVLGLVALAVIAVWVTGREKVLVGQELQDEVTAGVVTPDEYQTIVTPFRRFSVLAGALGKGMATWRLRRRLYVLEVELAFRKHHDKSDRTTPAKLLTPEEYRRQIAETRAALGGATATEAAS
jgi:RsiW-degrading membrane proteinase PrsW (M82 family)